jgi:esterase/lipase
MQGELDEMITPESAEIIHDTVSSQQKDVLFLSNSGHAITVDIERQLVWQNAFDFIRSRTSSHLR